MSERILKALMQLFAIIARPESNTSDRRTVVEAFLREQLNTALVNEYLSIFDDYYADQQKKINSSSRRKKRTAASSVRVLIICEAINQELHLHQKYIVLIRLLEFIRSEGEFTNQEYEFVSIVSQAFHISTAHFDEIKDFVLYSNQTTPESENLLLIAARKQETFSKTKELGVETMTGTIKVLQIPQAELHIFSFQGEKELYMNGQLLNHDKVHILSPGASLRNSKIKPLYYSDIVSTFISDDSKSRTVFEVNMLSYKFKNGVTGLHTMDFIEKSGKLIGIMGASGAGKSTLLHVLNGTISPTQGEVLINGVNIHKEPEKIEGLIGFVSQDDLLIEELTVYENLFFNAKLSFDNYSEFQVKRTVLKLLKNLGLYDIRNMKVGSPLNKMISGGQRKRLNIALELIREPAVLFLDEPTSGLSSRDSENILDLLKELALKGKLIFTVIHQPSSDIFKMFDKLLFLDTGGYLIYNGDPVESITYFKSRIRQANWNDSECPTCGNVNPEQIFNIVEAQVVDEYGRPTDTRITAPAEWRSIFEQYTRYEHRKSVLVQKLPAISFKIPNKIKQFKIYGIRDLLSKFTNKQYLLINFLEAPLLAFILSYIIKFYNVDVANSYGYNLSENSNLPVYLFMSVIVALFIGLTVSAQEIIKDRKILKREAFLNLSRTSYLLAKISILLGLAAVQAFLFVLIGNSIMEIKGMFWEYWFVLFSTWSFANMLGLNISDSFKTSINIYILIPFLIIPQIILSGVIVNFDKLNPQISSPSRIPFYGEMITSRWAYEALAVYQFRYNDYQKDIFEYERKMSNAEYSKDYWLKTLSNKTIELRRNLNKPEKRLENIQNLKLLRNELEPVLATKKTTSVKVNLEHFYLDKIKISDIQELDIFFELLKKYYIRKYNEASRERDKLIRKIQKSIGGSDAYKRLKKQHSNESLTEFVRNSNDFNKIVEYNGHLYQKTDPIYHNSKSWLIKSHFYAAQKPLFGHYFDTYWVNTAIIWSQIIFLYLALQFSWLKRTINYFDRRKFGKKQKSPPKKQEVRRRSLKQRISRFQKKLKAKKQAKALENKL